MKSMTGYGTIQWDDDKLSLVVTLKSVNGRFLDIRPHIPRQYHSFESEIKKTISAEIRRGTVDLYIQRKVINAEVSDIVINEKMAKKWKAAYEQVGRTLSLEKVDLNIETMAALPEVISINESLNVTDREKKQVIRVVKEALKAIHQERVREGKALKAELGSLLSELKKLLGQVSKFSGTMNAELKRRMQERLQSLDSEIQVDPQRVAQEVAMYLDKCDVREEISRLEEHIAMFQKLVSEKASIPTGKKMDFYCQELLREVNTIGSKSSLAKLTQTVVNAKSVVEKLREQVQNVE